MRIMQIELESVVTWMSIHLLANLLIILALQTKYANDNTWILIILSRLLIMSSIAMVLSVLFLLQVLIPGQPVEFSPHSGRKQIRDFQSFISVLLVIGLMGALYKRRCPGCGRRSLYLIFPGLSSFKYICMNCGHRILSKQRKT